MSRWCTWLWGCDGEDECVEDTGMLNQTWMSGSLA